MERIWMREAVRAVAEGPFLNASGDLHTLTGFGQEELIFIVESFETADDSEEDHALAINNCLNALLNFPHKQDHRWSEVISIPKSELAIIYDKWRRFREQRERRRPTRRCS
jgi:hypothetical protein